jgi:histidine triad (HIT) family protein
MAVATSTTCVFCEIIGGRSPASLIVEDDLVLAFMTLRPFAAGECTVIPRAHIDHFTDIEDPVAAHIIVVAQRIARRMRKVFQPQRVGMVVHGYGIAHAHLVLVPQNGPHDITSSHYARIEDDRIVFSMKHIPFAERQVLDAHAKLLAAD